MISAEHAVRTSNGEKSVWKNKLLTILGVAGGVGLVMMLSRELSAQHSAVDAADDSIAAMDLPDNRTEASIANFWQLTRNK